jgi:hypothetical protein
MSDVNWGVKLVESDGKSRWYTNARHTQAEAETLAEHYTEHGNRTSKAQFGDDAPTVTFRAEEIPEEEQDTY